ncbi:MAG: hypothetical protein P8X48_10685 [Acidiferrobacteraceae bacterium]|jgi:hypothetical protein
MNESRRVLLLFPGPDKAKGPAPQLLIDALEAAGARVQAHSCDDRYDEILDAVEQVDTIVFWR